MARTESAAIPLKALATDFAIDPLRFLKAGFITLTPAQMAQIREHAQYPRQRRVDGRHVATLAEIMRRGQWSSRDKLDFARIPGRVPILINGYHRTEAQIAAGLNIEWTVVIHDCATMAEVDALYHRFDTNVRMRGSYSILNSADAAERLGIGKEVAMCVYNAAPIMLMRFRSLTAKDADSFLARNMIDDRLRLVEEYAPEAKKIQAWQVRASRMLRRRFRTAAAWAVMLATTRQQSTVADEFWPRVFDQDGLVRNDPRAVLARTMLDTSFRDPRPIMITIALAWNAHWRRESREYLRASSVRKIEMIGTDIEIAQ